MTESALRVLVALRAGDDQQLAILPAAADLARRLGTHHGVKLARDA